MKHLKTVNSILLNTSKEKLWEILTQPEWTEKYMYNCRVISNFQVGDTIDWEGEFQGQKAFLTGTVLQIEKPNLLKYTTIDPTFGDVNNPADYVHVTYEVTEQNDQLLLTMVSEIFDGNQERIDHMVGGLENIVFPAIEVCISE